MKNTYEQIVETIHAPDNLQERVLMAAKQGSACSCRRHPILRAAVCAACALALVLGGLTLCPAKGETPGSEVSDRRGLVPTYSFGLTACALAANNSVAFAKQETEICYTVLHSDSLAGGEFTNYRFQVGGEGIRSVTLSIDKGGLYRYENGNYRLIGRNFTRNFTEEFDPAVSYGFWVPEEWKNKTGIHVFDGATLSVQAEYENGTFSTVNYRLTAERLKQFGNEDGTSVLVPALEGDEETHFGLYAVSTDSCFFRWPVQDSQIVSLSHGYGYRPDTDEQNRTFHPGIDIPAEAGAAITAPMDGVVLEVGFTPEEGNFLTLDHGDGLTTTYAHCKTLNAAQGETVKGGMLIATVGNTGMSTGPHLCFQVRQDGKAVNPVAYFSAEVRKQLHME